MGLKSQQPGRKGATTIVRLPCACATLRRTTRLVTQMYDDAVRPTGVTGPQFTLLQALKLAPGISQNQMGEILGIDSTTLTRSLALLRKHGWVRSEPGDDRRAWRLSLTKAGEKEYERVIPYWQAAQKRLKQALGERNWNEMLQIAEYAAEVLQLKSKMRLKI